MDSDDDQTGGGNASSDESTRNIEAEDYGSDLSDEALSLPSHLAPISATKDSEGDEDNLDDPSEPHHPHSAEDAGDSDADALDSGSDLEHISISDFDQIPPQTIIETRKYLKQHGNMKFLEKYLPTAASSEDIVRLIVQLGFVPRHLPKPDNSNIMVLIKYLNYAMVKVRSIRTRLDTVKTIDDALEQINKAQKILVITGAGISTSLGIPDFRSSKGFYSQVQHLGLSDPQEVFDLEIFLTDPSLFYSIAHMILPPEKIFSPLHSFIQVIQSKGKLLRNYTQNIDNLESYAGISPEKLIQCHGSFATATCVTCKYHVKGEEIFEDIKNREIPYCPKCAKMRKKLMKNDEDSFVPDSYGVLKPDITFFGEPLPETFHDLIRRDLSECDLLISVGTSLKVAPVADIVDKIPEHVPQILINKDPIDHCNFDVSLLGYCDDVASYLASRLGKSWDIPHKDFDSIRGSAEDPNLLLTLVDEEYREYEVVNRTTEQASLTEVTSQSDGLVGNNQEQESNSAESGGQVSVRPHSPEEQGLPETASA
ncbi:SIR2-domain-containing protein [Suhomyces tanzawaensis NRRL Y-17324]|uniref:SIR2-domain-containing protein n=1 Tax=Suhomyces tanzawaensis NRRL Y-17324 TaxID=984487 RepID=A0A1E4SEJ6_9ASCO|nr:SIR2-domain-containing protein [Suhomyces tanzawaensis NRRL Y-17324]ODV77949.1 SIR2-domain-containing protein [Suhomyces tanzawaensis NRRL Y-17324]